jgi:hypothetical protein
MGDGLTESLVLPFLPASKTSASWHILEHESKRKCIVLDLRRANNTVNLLGTYGNSCRPQVHACHVD